MSRIGSWSLHTIETGRFGLDGGAMFGIVPKPLWQKRIAADELNRIPLNARCLLLTDGDRCILVDNGIGNKQDEKFLKIYGVDTTTMELDASLSAGGFHRSDVTDVILTHLHFDHCGGSTERVNGTLRVAFPNALFHVQRRHWDWGQKGNIREKASFLPDNLEPLAASGQLNLIDGQTSLFPGVEVIPVDGHTQAMQLVRVHDAEKSLLYTADLLPTHAHLAPAWNMGYDLWPMTTIEEKARLLDQAIQGGWDLFFEHDPTVGLCSVRMGERGPEVVDPRPLAEL